MTARPDVATRLRAALETTAESAMTLTDTDKELERLRGRLPGANRGRRVRIAVGAAAVVAAAVAASVVVAANVSEDGTRRRDVGPTGGQLLPPGTVAAGFPLGTFEHPGTYGKTVLVLRRNATARLTDSRSTFPTEMAMRFRTPNQVSFTVTKISNTTLQCEHAVLTFTYSVVGGELRLTPVGSPCVQVRIPLSEFPWE